MKKLLYKLIIFFGIGFLVYLVHRYVYAPHFAQNKVSYINFNYLYNALACTLVLFNLWLISRIDTTYLGFSLVLMGLVKLVFLVVLVKIKGFSLDRVDFPHLFAPYALGKCLEIFAVIEMFKQDNLQ